MNRAPTIFTLDGLLSVVRDGPQSSNGKHGYVPARPLGFYSFGNRLRAAILVFTGRADAVRWPQDQ